MGEGGGLPRDSLCPHYSGGLPVRGTREAGRRGARLSICPFQAGGCGAGRARPAFRLHEHEGRRRCRGRLGPGNGGDGSAWRLPCGWLQGLAGRGGACARVAPGRRLLRAGGHARDGPAPCAGTRGPGRCQLRGCFQAAVCPGFFHFNGRVIKMKDQHFY